MIALPLLNLQLSPTLLRVRALSRLWGHRCGWEGAGVSWVLSVVMEHFPIFHVLSLETAGSPRGAELRGLHRGGECSAGPCVTSSLGGGIRCSVSGQFLLSPTGKPSGMSVVDGASHGIGGGAAPACTAPVLNAPNLLLRVPEPRELQTLPGSRGCFWGLAAA